MSTRQTASFCSKLAIPTELPIFDPEVQGPIDELDNLNNSIPLDYPFCEATEDSAKFDPLTFAMNENRYLSLYDLCRGDPTLVDTIRWANGSPSIVSSATTPPLVAATPSPTSDDFAFPSPIVGGKWVPGFHPGSVPTCSSHAAPPLAPSAPVTAPSPRPTTPGPAPASSNAGPSRSARSADHIRRRHRPYRKEASAQRKGRGSTEGKRMGRRGRVETRDYLDLYPALAKGTTRPQGYRALIREGRWGPIVVHTLRQIGVPYPTKGLQKILSDLYDGEGEQEGVPKGIEGRPALPWKVSLSVFLPSRTVPDGTPSFQGSLSWHLCVKKKGYGARSNDATFVKLENTIYPSCYWWISGTWVPPEPPYEQLADV